MNFTFALIFTSLLVSCASRPKHDAAPPELRIDTYLLGAGYPQTQQGASKHNLKVERRYIDDEIQLEVMGSIRSDRFGMVHIYRYHSAYSGERYSVFAVQGPTVHCITFSPHTRLDADTCIHRIEERLKTLRINHS